MEYDIPYVYIFNTENEALRFRRWLVVTTESCMDDIIVGEVESPPTSYDEKEPF